MPRSMGILARRTSSIHKVHEFPLTKVDVMVEYDMLQVVGEGIFAKVLLAEHKQTRAEVVLKAISKNGTSRREFFREFHYSYYLSPHPNVLKIYDVAFESERFFYFAQELAPFGDLASNVGEEGLGEGRTKKVITQIASALEFIHSKDLVHRDIKMGNILVFTSDLSLVKLADFGSTRKAGTMVRRRMELLPYCPPEVIDVGYNESYHASTLQDVWQMGILLYVLLTGSLPWQKADQMTDRMYAPYYAWQQQNTKKVPPKFKEFSSRLRRLFRRMLDPTEASRASISEIQKYTGDRWMTRRTGSWLSNQEFRTDNTDNINQCANNSTMSIHSSIGEKNLIFQTLAQYGIETVVDRNAKKERIRDWIQSS